MSLKDMSKSEADKKLKFDMDIRVAPGHIWSGRFRKPFLDKFISWCDKWRKCADLSKEAEKFIINEMIDKYKDALERAFNSFATELKASKKDWNKIIEARNELLTKLDESIQSFLFAFISNSYENEVDAILNKLSCDDETNNIKREDLIAYITFFDPLMSKIEKDWKHVKDVPIMATYDSLNFDKIENSKEFVFSFTNRKIIINKLNEFRSNLKTSQYAEDRELGDSIDWLIKEIKMLEKTKDNKTICSTLIDKLQLINQTLYNAGASKKRTVGKIETIIKKAQKDLSDLKQKDKKEN